MPGEQILWVRPPRGLASVPQPTTIKEASDLLRSIILDLRLPVSREDMYTARRKVTSVVRFLDQLPKEGA